MLGANAHTSTGLPKEGVIPPALVKDIFKDAAYDSAALKMAGTVPMPISGLSTPIFTGEPVAGVVGEGELKPVVKRSVSIKSVKPIKVASIMYHSKEARMADRTGFTDQFHEQLRMAIARAIDAAVFHGKDAHKNVAISGVESLAQTANAVRLGTATAKDGGLAADFITGYEQLVDYGTDLTGFVADPRLRPRFMRGFNFAGERLWTPGATPNLRDNFDTVLGVPTMYSSKAVSGHIGEIPDSYIRAFGGDFAANIKLGFTEQMTFRTTTDATIKDGDTEVNLFQQNMEAVLVEAIFGWVITDVNRFVKYTVAPAAFQSGKDYPAGALVTGDDNNEYRAKTDVKAASTAPESDSSNWEAVA